MKGEQVVPKSLRKNMKERLHVAHMGCDSMVRRARKCILWLGMAQEVVIFVTN